MTDWAKLIADQYDKTLTAKRAQLQAQYQQNAAAYQKELKDAAAQYQTLKNDAYVDNALAEKSRKEAVANMGLSGEGGTALTWRQRNMTQLLTALGDASRQQQDHTDNVNLALANLGTQYSADVTDAQSDNAAQRSKALIEQGRWQAGHDMDLEKMARDREKMVRETEKSLFEQAYKLYLKRLITAAQFKAMTGISLRR